MMVVKYIEKGEVHDFKRVDTVKTIRCQSAWIYLDIIYCRVNDFEVRCIAIEDIISLEG